jgi:hypothetical protein
MSRLIRLAVNGLLPLGADVGAAVIASGTAFVAPVAAVNGFRPLEAGVGAAFVDDLTLVADAEGTGASLTGLAWSRLPWAERVAPRPRPATPRPDLTPCCWPLVPGELGPGLNPRRLPSWERLGRPAGDPGPRLAPGR